MRPILKIKKIILIYPPTTKKQKFGKLSSLGSVSPPLGLVYLGTVLKEKGFQVKILDADAHNLNHEAILAVIKNWTPDLVGISSVTLTIESALQLAEKIKTEKTAIPIVLGGHHISVLPQETIRQSQAVDIGVIGEGEETIIKIIDYLEDKISLNNIPGIIFRQNERITETKKRRLLENLDALPVPDYSLLNNYTKIYRPAVHRAILKKPCVSVIASRGCIYNCNFCCRTIDNSTLRVHSVDYVIKLLRNLVKKFQIRSFVLEDELFYIAQEQIKEFCLKINEYKLNLSWACPSHPDIINEQILPHMRQAGCKQIYFGLESGSPKILDILGKNINLKETETKLKLIKQHGIGSAGTFMLGCPGETEDTLQETMKLILNYPLDYIIVYAFQPTPGAKIFKEYKQWGVFDTTFSKQNQVDLTFIPTGLAKETIENYRRLIYKKFYLHPKRIFSGLKIMPNLNPADYIRAFKYLFN